MKNTCKAAIAKAGLSDKEVSGKFDDYVSLQKEANSIAAGIGQTITDRVNNYDDCTCTFTIAHTDWNTVAKTCFKLGNFFGMHGIPIEFAITDEESVKKIIVLNAIHDFFVTKGKEAV
jgi:hypothetical protein